MSKIIGRIARFSCEAHGTKEVYASVGELPLCPACRRAMQPVQYSRKTPGLPYDRPVYSVAAGVSPNQVEEHRRAHPEVAVTDDGCVVFEDHYQRKRFLKKIGMIDRDGY